jgi:hypothetical protein
MIKLLKGYRTLIANILMAGPVVWDVAWLLTQTPEFKAIIPIEYMPYYSLGMVTVNLFLRKITTTPMGTK